VDARFGSLMRGVKHTRAGLTLGRQRGFTLVELVAVIVLLGALGAIAIPKLVDLGAEAHKGAVAATAGAFGSAVNMSSAICTARGWAGKDNLPGYGNGTVDFNTACFPTDTNGNANSIGNSNTRCMRVWNAVLAIAPSITTANSGADYRARARNQVCTFRYLLDGSATRQFTYDSRNGLVVLTDP